jgi:hypothetical protein
VGFYEIFFLGKTDRGAKILLCGLPRGQEPLVGNFFSVSAFAAKPKVAVAFKRQISAHSLSKSLVRKVAKQTRPA